MDHRGDAEAVSRCDVRDEKKHRRPSAAHADLRPRGTQCFGSVHFAKAAACHGCERCQFWEVSRATFLPIMDRWRWARRWFRNGASRCPLYIYGILLSYILGVVAGGARGGGWWGGRWLRVLQAPAPARTDLHGGAGRLGCTFLGRCAGWCMTTWQQCGHVAVGMGACETRVPVHDMRRGMCWFGCVVSLW